MQVRIENECFFSVLNYQDLQAIFSLFVEEQHTWIDCDLEEIKKSNWYEDLGRKDKIDIEKIFKKSTRKTIRKTISITNNCNDLFNVRASKLYLKQPLVILIENKDYDSPFYEAIIRNFDNEATITDAHKNKFWKYEHFAGSSIEQVINSEIRNEFNDESFKIPKYNYLRYYVILDSDKLTIENTNNDTTKKEVFLNNVETPFHTLQKREKENYMPERILKSLNDIYYDTILKELIDNSSRKRDFFDFEKGFNKKNKNHNDWKNTRKDEFDFFEIENINDADYVILKYGIKSNGELSESKVRQDFKRNFSRKFNEASKDDLLNAIKFQNEETSKFDGKKRNEFEHIIHEIKYLL